MRSIVNISLPFAMVKMVKKEVKSGHYASTSEFFRHILRSWMKEKTLREIKQGQKEIKKGNGKILHSLKDLR